MCGCSYEANDWYMYKTIDVVHTYLYMRNLNLYKLQGKNIKVFIRENITRNINSSSSKSQLPFPIKQESTTATTTNRVLVKGNINFV